MHTSASNAAPGRHPASAAPVEVNLDLVRKYSVAGPRYTSYPPATQFTDAVKAADLLPFILSNNETRRPLSLYFHLPFCRSLCWYCGCTTVITTQQHQSASYLDVLEREMDAMCARMNPEREVVQIHFGGGTPTFLQPDELRRLGDGIRKRFRISERVEAGVEIDPRWLSRDHIAALREAGFNRASLGVQDHDPEVQKAVHRIQPYDETRKVIEWLREFDFQSVNIDLIYGLPFQTPASFARTLTEVLQLNPDRFAVFNYAHVPWLKPAQRIFKEGVLPSPEAKLQLLKLTIETLTQAGYNYVGMDHFARPEDELVVSQANKTLQRNFQGYSTCGDADIYSFGMSAIGQTPDIYWQNLKELPEYCAAVEAGQWPVARGYVATAEDKLRRDTIMRLMSDLSLDYAEMSQRHGVDFASHFSRELESLSDLEADGLLRRTSSGLEVSGSGRLLIRNIAMRFDAYLPAQASEGRFSKTI